MIDAANDHEAINKAIELDAMQWEQPKKEEGYCSICHETRLTSKTEKERGSCDWCKLKKSQIGGRVK